MIDIRRHHVGMVFQHFGLLPHQTVLGNVAFPLKVQGPLNLEGERHIAKYRLMRQQSKMLEDHADVMPANVDHLVL